jgi:hypothetical protein
MMDQEMKSDVLKAALEYAELGYSVVPLIRGMKKPPKGVTWVNRRFKSADECSDKEWKAEHPNAEWGPAGKEQLKQWFEVEHPTANIGILTGAISEIDTIDEDGPHAHETLVAQSGIDLPDTVTSVTGRTDGGKQRIFQYHGGGLKNTAKFCDNGNGSQCDIRTDGGLIVAPPSIHKSGKRYEWEVDPRIEDPAPFPPELIRFIHEQQNKQKTTTKDGTTTKVDYDEYFRNGIPDGDKHHGLFKFACKRISQGLQYPEVLLLTTEAARHCNPLPKDGPEKAAKVRVDEAWAKYGDEHTSDSVGGEPPTDITRPIPPAPDFPLDCLPDAPRAYVEDVSHRMQVPHDMIVISMLIQFAGLIGSGVVLRPKAQDDWVERACLWGYIVAHKGSMKSPAFQAGTKELRRIQAEKAEEHKEELAKWKEDRDEYNLRKKAHEKNLKKELARDPNAELPPTPDFVADFPEEPNPARLVVADVTTEKLADEMEPSRGLTLFRDELSGYMLNMNRYNTGSDRQFYLECHSGGSYYVDRVGRGSQYIGDLYLNIGGGVQPKVAREIFGEDSADDGFNERFGLIGYPEKRTEWKLVDEYPDRQTQTAMSDMCDILVRSVWEDHLPRDEDNRGQAYGKPYVRFDVEAQGCFNDWLSNHMKMLAAMDENDPLIGFYSKERGLFCRVCLVLHLATCASTTDPYDTISLDTLKKTIRLFESYIEPMWDRVMAAFGRTSVDDAAKKIAEWIRQEKPEFIKPRDIQQNGWRDLKDLKSIDEALNLLIAHRWIGEGQTTTPGPKGGRPSLAYKVNPLVWG